MRFGMVALVALGAPALVTLLAFTSVRTVVPGILYVVAIILATVVEGRIGGLVAVVASAFPFVYFFASRYDRNELNAAGATALVVFFVAALFGSEALGRERAARERAERQEWLFEKFYRLDPALTRGVGGSGLGLFISRELVARMGGSLTVRSEPGEGAVFVVDLPAA
jgi:K+-sensing histidine kinase KdpD